MAFYDIAARQQRISPVQEMLQARAQQDAHDINRLNIQKAEIQMPYVEQLTQQQVERNELAIAAAKTQSKYQETQIENQIEAQENQIELQELAISAGQRKERYQEARASGEVSDEVLRRQFPDEWYADWAQENEVRKAGMAQFAAGLSAVLQSHDKESAFALALRDAPPEMRQMFAGPNGQIVYPGDDALRTMQRQLQKLQESSLESALRLYDEAVAAGDDERAQMILAHINRMSGAGRGTGEERRANRNWRNSDNPINDQEVFDEYNDLYHVQLVASIRDAGIGLKALEAKMAGALDKPEFTAYIEQGDIEAFEERWDHIKETADRLFIEEHGLDAFAWWSLNKDLLRRRGQSGVGLKEWDEDKGGVRSSRVSQYKTNPTDVTPDTPYHSLPQEWQRQVKPDQWAKADEDQKKRLIAALRRE